MASRVLSLFQYFQRGNVAATASGPNGWAKVSLWRRFFELQEKKEQEECETFTQLLDEIYEEEPTHTESEVALRSRREMIQEHYRGLRNEGITHRFELGGNSASSNGTMDARSNNSSASAHGYREASLDIPVGNFDVTLAQ